jgi:transcriptional regulator with XRE-family HTH domain
MDFAQRLVSLRKAKGLTQQALAERVGCSLIQIHRYESAGAQPTLDVIRRLALALTVSTDELIFGADARGPDDDFRLQFEALATFDPEEKKVAKAVLDSLILKHQARRWASAS